MDNDLDETFWDDTVSQSEYGILDSHHCGSAYRHFNERCILEDETEEKMIILVLCRVIFTL